MSTYHLSHNLGFLHWEAHPSLSRQALTLSKDCKAGDLLIYFDNGYQPLVEGQDLGLQPEVPPDGLAIAVALEDGVKGKKIMAVTKLAVLIIERVKPLTAAKWKERSDLRLDAQKQSLSFVEEAKVLVDTRKEGL